MEFGATDLIDRGFFPRELPPPFTTTSLTAAADLALPAIKERRTECIRHNLARVGGFRRLLKVPNPINFIHVAQVIEELWPQIDEHLKQSMLSMSRPVPSRSERCLVPQYRFSEKPWFRARHRAGARFVLQSDVSQCYSSIYTHSLPWALHGKAYAKANQNKTDTDELDLAIRLGSGGQTIGLPIGPDTSLVAAEIVLTAVDRALQEALGDHVKGFRYLDDYELCFRTRTEAEEAQSHLEAALADYELAINPTKTRILELPQPLQEEWPHRILTFTVRTATAKKTANDLVALYSLAGDLARRNPGALKYALQRSRDVSLTKEFWPLFQHLVWSAVSAEPTTAATAVDLLRVKSEEIEEPVARRVATETLEALIAANAPIRNSSEVTWALWGAIVLGLNLSPAAAEAVSRVEDDFVALLALHAELDGRFGAEALITSSWETLIGEEDALKGPHWLLAYEAGVRGWLAEGPDEPTIRSSAILRVRTFGSTTTVPPGILSQVRPDRCPDRLWVQTSTRDVSSAASCLRMPPRAKTLAQAAAILRWGSDRAWQQRPRSRVAIAVAGHALRSQSKRSARCRHH